MPIQVTGHMKIQAMPHVKSVKDDATGSVKNRDDGFVQSSKRKTCKLLGKTDGTPNANRSNEFDVLNLTENGLEVDELSAVDVPEILEITADAGASPERLADPKEGPLR